MDIKDLNKLQLLMMAVLLSFIVSIATGITTVTLMQQAPASFTMPVNRIIKQTVEKIQQVEGKTTVQTVVVKEEDLVVDAIAKNKSAVFFVNKETLDSQSSIIDVPAGRGFVVSKDGILVTDALLVPDKAIYYVKNDSGKFKADFISADKAGFSFLKIGAPADEKNKSGQTSGEVSATSKAVVDKPSDKDTFTPVVFGDLSKMKTGQKIIVLGNSISSFIFEGSKNIRINNTKLNAGGLVLNLDGEALGIVLSADETSFVPINFITDTLKPKEVPKTSP